MDAPLSRTKEAAMAKARTGKPTTAAEKAKARPTPSR